MPCKMKYDNKNANSADCYILKLTELYALETYLKSICSLQNDVSILI